MRIGRRCDGVIFGSDFHVRCGSHTEQAPLLGSIDPAASWTVFTRPTIIFLCGRRRLDAPGRPPLSPARTGGFAPPFVDGEDLKAKRTMPRIIEGKSQQVSGQIAVVVARYNDSITKKLLAGALSVFTGAGLAESQVDEVWVPGAFEIPLVVEQCAHSGRYVAIVTLGAVIRGETTHDQHINRTVSHQIADISVRYRLPVLFGVLTVDTLEQAIQRAGGRHGNKGAECAHAALELVSLLSQLA